MASTVLRIPLLGRSHLPTLLGELSTRAGSVDLAAPSLWVTRGLGRTTPFGSCPRDLTWAARRSMPGGLPVVSWLVRGAIYRFPRPMLEMPPCFLSILGAAPACGKSYFLASMTWRLRKILPSCFRAGAGRCRPVDEPPTA